MTIKIEYFSDVLCIWAYAGQVRVDELKHAFQDKIELHYRFIPLFAAPRERIGKDWHGKGGFEGFNRHLMSVAKNWDHIEVHPDIWTKVVPESCQPVHLFLKAVQLLEDDKTIAYDSIAEFAGRTLFEQTVWRCREAFFRQARNIALRTVQDEIASELELPIEQIHQLIDSGQAHAALYLDDEAKHGYKVPGSPTMVLNEGRQLLYGNVGYRIIDANVRELLNNQHHGEASWC